MLKKTITALLLVTLIASLTLTGVNIRSAQAQTTQCGTATTGLILTGDGYNRGNVTVYNTIDRVYTTFTANSGWTISQLSYHVSGSAGALPKNADGTLNYNAFVVQQTYNPPVASTTVSRQLSWPVGTKLFIAARLVLVNGTSQITVYVNMNHVAQACSTPAPTTPAPTTPAPTTPAPTTPAPTTPAPTTPAPTTPAPTEQLGVEGCTPGYWKQTQHFDSWVGYSPNQSFSSVFGRTIPGYPNLTLLQALKFSGGGVQALARHVVAALLNAASGDVDYAYSSAQIVTMFQQAFDSKSYESTKNKFDRANNGSGGCPLN